MVGHRAFTQPSPPGLGARMLPPSPPRNQKDNDSSRACDDYAIPTQDTRCSIGSDADTKRDDLPRPEGDQPRVRRVRRERSRFTLTTGEIYDSQ